MIWKLLINFLIFFIIYYHGFTSLGNTTYRANSTGQIEFSLLPMFTEGFIGPIRTLFLLLISCNTTGFFSMGFEFVTNFWSPYSVLILLYLINKNYFN